MRKLVAMVLCLLLLSSVAFAVDIAIITGMRDGLAIGITIDQETGEAIAARYGIELSDGAKPVIAFIGGKTFLTEVQSIYPLYISGGLVGYVGDGDTKVGLSLSVILDEVFGIDLLSIETGIDALADDSKIQIQAIYGLNSF